MKRKKQGASLIMVVIVFMFVFTVSIATLSMVASNYKARVVESKKVENLYSSDSGLDVAYNIIGKTFDAATKYGYWEVDALTKSDGSNKGPNNPKYAAIVAEINELNTAITDLKAEKNSVNESNINSRIAEKRSLIEEDKQLQELLINEEFQRAFKNFIAKTSEVGQNEVVPDLDKLKDSIKRTRYVSSVPSININEFKEATVNFSIDDTNADKDTSDDKIRPTLSPDVIAPTNDSKQPMPMNDKHSEVIKQITKSSPDQKYNITVTSEFYSKKYINGVEYDSTKTDEKPPNLRQLQANYIMSVPNYKDIYFQNSTGDLHEYLALNDNRALTIGGDMNVNNATELTVNDNIFVEGTDPTTIKSGNSSTVTPDNRTFEKYHGGITLSNSEKVNFLGDVITRNTFNIRDNVDATIGGNLYGRNVYMGGQHYDYINKGLDESARGSTLNVKSEADKKGQVILDNDLAFKADKSSSINIKDFYGINDKNISYEDLGNPSNKIDLVPDNKVKTSSSIIVNSTEPYTDTDTPKSITITHSAYIMGTAHIDTKESIANNGYQTGESGAVNRNYIAYSIPLDDAEKFDYYDPLQLLDEPNVFNKAKHFAKYWNGKNANTGGIQWPINKENIHSVGAIVDNTQQIINPPNYSQTLEQGPNGAVYKARLDFASKVYKFGQKTDHIVDYSNPNETSFDSLMTLSEETIGDKYKLDDLGDPISSDGEKAIFNYDENITLVLKSKDSKTTVYKNLDGSEISNIRIINNDSDNINAVIATNGNVIIDGGITFKGAIIAKGNLTVIGNAKINYDKEVIERVQAQNIDLFENVFGESTIVDTTDNQNADDLLSTDKANYDLKNFLESKLWKILK